MFAICSVVCIDLCSACLCYESIEGFSITSATNPDFTPTYCIAIEHVTKEIDLYVRRSIINSNQKETHFAHSMPT